MTDKKDQIVSAQAVLRPASGKSIQGATITAANVHEFAPSPEAAAKVKRSFADAGFEVGEVVGNSFSITAPASTFERTFKTRLRRREGGGIEAAQTRSSGSLELPLDVLPKSTADLIEAVTFTPPPDFGPTDF